MAKAAQPPKVKLICGMIASDADLFDAAVNHMSERFSPVDVSSDVMDFDFTHYYDSQMGSPLYRKFVAFTELVTPDFLIAAKCFTNELEDRFAAEVNHRPVRPINLDVGYVEQSKLVLGSMKNFSHRVYLGSGVYGEVTLMFCKGKWEALNWTFPDYGSGRYDSFLTAARDALRQVGPQ